MLERAGQHAGRGADALFARLDALRSRPDEAAAVLDRLAARIRAGEWDASIAAVVEAAAAIDTSFTATVGESAGC